MDPHTELPTFFHPVVRSWFAERLGTPTDVQARAWPEICAGRHVLISAPTGSGKTLTAFLWALDQLLSGAWSGGCLRVLYVSPLKALNYDIQRNLEQPLAELTQRFRAAGLAPPAVRVQTRTGDTPGSERQRMVRRPPEVLITTPESLNILLTSRGGRRLMTGLSTVILDEIHSVAGNKRGTHLVTAVERLAPLVGEVQRIGISATVRPLETVAEFLGGYRLEYRGETPSYAKRPVSVVRSEPGEKGSAKRYDVRVEFPAQLRRGEGAAPADDGGDPDTFWRTLAKTFRQHIRVNRSTLLFCNSRRLTERLTRLINEEQPKELAYSHHGSLSREIRSVVEQRLKDGELAAIVATNSLELGIDIGQLDEVLLIQTPPSISSAIQRVGRSGHGVGEVSRGRLFPTFGRDFIDAAVVARGILEQDIEPLHVIERPLDVLAQVLLSMVAGETWRLDEIYDQIRTSQPYHQLRRRSFDLVIEMLAGRYADSRVRELEPRVTVDRVAGTVRGRDGAARAVYLAGGTIPDRGYFSLRLLDGRARLGELDEEFVWERSVGDSFTLGTQAWRVEAITHDDVLVSPVRGSAALAPFWRAEARDRDSHLSEAIACFLEAADERLEQDDFQRRLREEHCLDATAAEELLDLLRRQREMTGCDLPHRHHLVVERFQDQGGPGGRRQILLHTFWGGRVNRPLAIALSAAWEERYGRPLEVMQDDDCLNLILPETFDLDDVFGLVAPGDLERLLRRRLERTGFFGARFRECAARALLLPRGGFKSRVPLWLNRLRAKKLLEAVSPYEDFPVIAETWRTCLQDEFDLPRLERLLGEVRHGEIRVSEVHTSTASPFGANMVWAQTNRLMYEDDTPEGGGPSRLRGDLLRELVFSSQLRPRLAPDLVRRFEEKLQRLAPGYAPRGSRELLHWLEERLLLPLAEWHLLVAAMRRDAPGEDLPELPAGRAAVVSLPGAEPVVCALANLPRLARRLGFDATALQLERVPGDSGGSAQDPAASAALRSLLASEDHGADSEAKEPEEAEAALADLVAEWIRFYGPFERPLLERTFGLQGERLDAVLDLLAERQTVVVDQLTRTAATLEICDAENLEILLRLSRAEARPVFEPLALAKLPLLLAMQQGLVGSPAGMEGLQSCLEALFGFPAPARAWEQEILPARLVPYYPAWLDSLMQETELTWFGCGHRQLTFAFASDLPLLREEPGEEESEAGGEDSAETVSVEELFPDLRGRFEPEELADHRHLPMETLQRQLWQLAWQGEVSSETFATVRRGVELRFEPPSGGAARTVTLRRSSGARPGRGGRWQSPGRFAGGRWYALGGGDAAADAAPLDALEREEWNKDRVRVLLDRYGILFRELLARELPALRWGAVFRSLRIMELSGEVLTGRFFDGIPGLQFISPATFRVLREGLAEDAIFWLNAADPASLCGVDLEELKKDLPARRLTTHLVFHGSRLVVVSRRSGRHLDVRVGPDHPRLGEYLGFLKVLLGREAQPRRSVEVAFVNEQPVLESPYRPVLESLFSTTLEAWSVKLRKRYGP